MSDSPVVAVFADVHGNYPALRACLAYAEGLPATHYLFLGDYITDHPYPGRTIELLYEAGLRHECRFIRGNREEYMIAHRQNPNEWREGSCQGALLYCYDNLTPADIGWFQRLPIAGSWEIGDAPAFGYCHGSPERTRAEMRGDPESLAVLARQPEDFLIKGHNHRVWTITHQDKRMVCAGSVGNPIYRNVQRTGPVATPYAKAAIMTVLRVENGAWRSQALLIPYDWEEALDNLKASGLYRQAPIWAAMLRHSVLTGENPFGVVPGRAARLYQIDKKTAGRIPWPDVPEAYWRRAAREFGIEIDWD